jgi:tRNA A37 threonylcarbamoyltransferase TsaD
MLHFIFFDYLEKKLKEKIKKEDLSFALRYPVKKQYRLDNAAMIGCLAYYQKKYKVKFKNFEPNVTK